MGEEDDGEAYFGVVSVFNPPEADVLELVVVAAVVAVELEPLDPQPAASSSAEQTIAALHVDWPDCCLATSSQVPSLARRS